MKKTIQIHVSCWDMLVLDCSPFMKLAADLFGSRAMRKDRRRVGRGG